MNNAASVANQDNADFVKHKFLVELPMAS